MTTVFKRVRNYKFLFFQQFFLRIRFSFISLYVVENHQIRYTINDAEKEISGFLEEVGTETNEDKIRKKIQELDLLNKIENMNTWKYKAIQVVPLLLQIIMDNRMHRFIHMIKAIIVLLGNLRPDGCISEYAFSDIVAGTPFTKEEIFTDLENRGYIDHHTLTPKFKPMDENFHFDIDPRFSELKKSILEILLSVPKDTTTAYALITLLKDHTLVRLYPDIIRALAEIGHPMAIPVLLDLVQDNQEAAQKALVRMGLNDSKELKQLLDQGVTNDVWGNDLREKVFVSVRDLLPFLLEALQSAEYSKDEKRLICFLFYEMGEYRHSDLEIFVTIFPELYEQKEDACIVTRLLVAGGKKIIRQVCRILEKDLSDTTVTRRYCSILGKIGPDAEEALPLLQRLSDKGGSLSGYVMEIIDKIQPSTNEKPGTTGAFTPPSTIPEDTREGEKRTVVTDTEPGEKEEKNSSINKVKKESAETDPGEYILY
jgi:hypothetical protein